jgi:hypothetical protein
MIFFKYYFFFFFFFFFSFSLCSSWRRSKRCSACIGLMLAILRCPQWSTRASTSQCPLGRFSQKKERYRFKRLEKLWSTTFCSKLLSHSLKKIATYKARRGCGQTNSRRLCNRGALPATLVSCVVTFQTDFYLSRVCIFRTT